MGIIIHSTVMQTIKAIFGETITSELDIWIKDKADKIRQPIKEQYEENMIKLNNYDKMQYALQKRMKQRKFLYVYLPLTIIAYILLFIFIFYWRYLDLSTLFIAGFVLIISITTIIRVAPDFPSSSEDRMKLLSIQRETSVLNEQIKKLGTLKDAESEILFRSTLK